MLSKIECESKGSRPFAETDRVIHQFSCTALHNRTALICIAPFKEFEVSRKVRADCISEDDPDSDVHQSNFNVDLRT